MRQPPGNGDILEIIEIDVIDADPSAFGTSGGRHAPVRERRPRPRWVVPAGVAASAAMALAVVVWQPWNVPPQWRTFDSPAPTTATISNLLLPAVPPGQVVSVVEPDAVGSNAPTTAPGYVFAEPGATFGFRRAAIFEATPTGARDASPATDEHAGEPTVHGVPAALDTFRLRNEIEWGPLSGHSWRVFTTGLTEQESLSFAAAVGAPNGAAAVQYDHRLDGMVPLGSVSAFNSAYSLRNELTGGHLSSDLSPTVINYAVDTSSTDEVSTLRVASVPAPPDAMQLVGYLFGAGTALTVHGQPAQLIHSRESGPMVIWLEGGRLITVAGPQADERLLAIAESIRPVSADEWLNAVSPVLEYYIPIESWPQDTAPIDVGSGVTSAGTAWRVAVTIGNPTVTCVYVGEAAGTSEAPGTGEAGGTGEAPGTGEAVGETGAEVGTSTITSGSFVIVTFDAPTGTPVDDGTSMCTFSTPRVPATCEFTGAIPGLTFVVAILPIEEFRLVLRVTAADGSITDHEPVRLNDEYMGVAIAIDPAATYSLVDPSA